MQEIQIAVSESVYTRLQTIARPFIDTTPGMVIERLLDERQPRAVVVEAANHLSLFHSATFETKQGLTWPYNGHAFPVGSELFKEYKGQEFWAKIVEKGIEYDGKVYKSPTAAAKAVKNAWGITGSAAEVNGKQFWEIRVPGSSRFIRLDKFMQE